jgi:hypothetical protein
VPILCAGKDVMIMIPFTMRRRGYRRSPARLEAAPCFACGAALSIGPARGRGFCAECWQRSRIALADEELGGEA